MERKKVQIETVKLDPSNPRSITKEKFEELKKSIKDFPEMEVVKPLIIADDFVIGGNMRLLAYKDLGYREVHVIDVTAWTQAKRDEFMIKDNTHYGSWDYDMLANEWDNLPLNEWGVAVWEPEEEELKGLTDEDDVPEAPQEPITKLGDVWILGEHRVMCGDSTSKEAVEILMDGEKADMVFTDPPYNIDYQGVKDKREKIKNDKMSDADFTQFLTKALSVDTDTFYVCCSWQYSHLFRKAMDNLGKPVKSFIVWNKVNPAQHLDKYFKQHEIILYHGKFGGQKTLRGDIWEVKRERNTTHPTMKPISLIEIALKDNEEKKLIYDAFLGSGSTLIAAEKTKRKCYGMELDPKYCDVIIKRWEDFTGKKATREIDDLEVITQAH